MGTMLARSVIDERVIDLPLNKLFWDLVLSRPVSLQDISKVDEVLGKTLCEL